MAKPLRIAILGFSLESNRNSPVSDRLIFEQTLYLAQEELLQVINSDRSLLPGTVRGFCEVMDSQVDWIPVPAVLAEAPPGGPVDHDLFLQMLTQMESALLAHSREHGQLDGVYISEHGAALTTALDDADGAVFEMVRNTVGPNVPVIATLDLHGHVTDRMNDSTDLMIAYLTNPHIDQLERGREAAQAMLEMQTGMRPVSAFVKVPMISPAVSLLTAAGPYADLIRYGQSCLNPSILNISLLAGFAPADASTNGLSVVVTAREDAAAANALAKDLATRAWSERHRYKANLTSIEDSLALAARTLKHDNSPSVLLADVADNPGGGGRGNTTYLLRQLHEKGINNAVIGMMFDPALASEAYTLGEGCVFMARFNRDETTRFSEPWQAQAEVLQLVDGTCVGRRGIYADRQVDMGPCALLSINGIRVAVVSRRHQCADPVFLERLGINLAATRVLVIKSRGHFRAGFDEYYKPEQIIEVDAPGLTTPDLPKLNLSRVPRPVYPLDPDMSWAPN